MCERGRGGQWRDRRPRAGDDAADQRRSTALIALDGTPQKRRLGGNALVAVSMAALHAAANAAGHRSMRICSARRPRRSCPCPKIQIFGGGAHAGRRVEIQDFMIVAPRAHFRPGARMDRRGVPRRRRD
jgi:enolase